ncbi:MAG: universal stress protein [Rhodospirillaceae bacterium]|nr:universal stress protein [Rhodospirillaceae bacterium]
MIYLAYDGSINGDWIAWYAINLAHHDPDRKLCVICVNTDEINPDEIRTKGEQLGKVCADIGVEVTLELIPSSGFGVDGVFNDIVANVTQAPETLLVCGARLQSGNKGYISGSVAEKLLSDKKFSVVAVRVTQPGILGAPRRLLVPVGGKHKGVVIGADLIKRIAKNIERIDLLHVAPAKRQTINQLFNAAARSVTNNGWEEMRGLDVEFSRLSGVDKTKIHINVQTSNDWADEVIISANRHKAHLILMEASIKDLQSRMMYANPIETVLRNAPCDVAIYRGA